MTILYCLKKPKSLYFQRFSDFNSFLKMFNLHVEVAEKLYFLYVLEQLFIFCLVCRQEEKRTRYSISYASCFTLQAPYKLPYSVSLSFLIHLQCTLSVSGTDHSYIFCTCRHWIYSRLLRSFVLSLSHLFFFCELPVSSIIHCNFFLLYPNDFLFNRWFSFIIVSQLFSACVFLTLINIEFNFLVSIKMYHIQRIQQIKRLFSVVSTPVYLLPLSPPVQMILSVFFFLICFCPLFWSRSGKDMILLLWLSL